MRWPSKSTFRLQNNSKRTKTLGATAVGIENNGFETNEKQPRIDIETIYNPNCDERYTTKNADDNYNNEFKHIVDMDLDSDIQQKYSKPNKQHWLLRRIYFLTWIRLYDREQAMSDLIAGITLGLTIIPQSIAYASLAKLSPEYGLYSAFAGSILYVFFGTIPQVSIGPTSLMALLTMQYCGGKPVQFTIVLAFLAGLVELLMGAFQLGFIVSFIPAPVTKAFTTGTAFIVVIVQIKNLLGIRGEGVPSFMQFFRSFKNGDAIIGISCITVLLLLRLLSQVKFKQDTPTTRRLKKLLWYVSISRNALVVFCSASIAYVWIAKQSSEALPFALSSKVSSALPTVKLPPFVFEAQNQTYVFTDILHELGSGIFVVPIVAVLANVAIAKAFVKDGNLDASQEMLTLGICNLVGSFFSAMPTCGAFTRSAVSQASGVRTPMAGIYTGLIVLSALSILTPYFQYIPKSALSAVLIAAVIFMIEFKVVAELWRSNKKDFFSWMGCFIICLFAGVEKGLLFGIVLSMIYILLRLGNPKLDVNLKKYEGNYYIHIVPNSDVYYTGVDTIRNELRAACALYRHDFPVLLECSRFMQFDATFIEMLNAVAKELHAYDVKLILHRLNPKWREMLPVTDNLRFSSAEEYFCTKETEIIQKQ